MLVADIHLSPAKPIDMTDSKRDGRYGTELRSGLYRTLSKLCGKSGEYPKPEVWDMRPLHTASDKVGMRENLTPTRMLVFYCRQNVV